MTAPELEDCLFLSGPTASRKSAVAAELARRIGGEVISMDSMAVYRGMDIGTAKPSAEERAAVPHHLLDVVDPGQEYSVAQYLAAARTEAAAVKARGARPIFVGGTVLYLKALLRGIFAGPPADWPLRRTLEELAARDGEAALHARLAAVDPATAQRLHPHDVRRVIRAIEVFELTGQPISEHQQQWDRQAEPRLPVFVLLWTPAELHARIRQRVEAMFAGGLIEEVRGLAARGMHLGPTAAHAIGYREAREHLAGKLTREEAIERTCLRTRQLAKRQLTFLRSLGEAQFVPLSEPVDAPALADGIIALIASRSTSQP